MEEIFKMILHQNRQMAEQNQRLMVVMERFTNQAASHQPANNPELVIESLSSNIREFCYDPDSGLTFDRWYQKYEDFFLLDGSKLDDAAKVRLLLRSLNVTVHDSSPIFVLVSNHDIEAQNYSSTNYWRKVFIVERVTLLRNASCILQTGSQKKLDDELEKRRHRSDSLDYRNNRRAYEPASTVDIQMAGIQPKYHRFPFGMTFRDGSEYKDLFILFGTRISLFSRRYDCFQVVKQPDEDYVTYAGTVNKRCEDFELGKITPDQFKSLIFIRGLQSSKDADVRTRLK
ncbi:uncharacterized protein LOC129752816 [Uranotaenia lowii]|uniref:uncharacterized protein LOC129752816 n=1 Tax=Uranotaenia lowii TaxID=190385 RepID=UPI00247AE902|nr:uncharacterized protein LOC129752816 [Uranotaenia lowii]